MSSTQSDGTTAPELDRATKTRVLLGSMSGSSIEWFDFFLYATTTPLVFDKLYFPTGNATVSLMISYVALALTFFVRPIGGALFAHIGDRVGRKKTLVLTLSLMGGATVAIGLIPTYAAIGIWAPVLLVTMRIVQGIAIGGEWGGAILLAYEYAPKQRRGLFGSVPATGSTVGLLMATAALAAVNQLPEQQFLSWGWRIPFVASLVLVLVGLWIRGRLDETPAFRRAREEEQIAKLPLVETLRDHWRAVLVAIGAKVVETAPFYIFATFSVGYATDVLGHSENSALSAVSIGAAVGTVMIPVMGRLSDRFGRRRVFVVGAALLGGVGFPYFLLLEADTGWALVLAAVLAIGLVWPAVAATLPTMTSEIFSTRVRYTGITLGYQIGAALAGGTAPLLATYLLAEFDDHWLLIALYLLLLAVVSIASVAGAGKIADKEEQGEEPRVNVPAAAE
ncbi:MFS transporter [Streptomyces sp. NBC_00063]|uniref:MFS transporter n=1 Tax=Streptomyces sp. NBC_00063 TaxID=2975638 RepID=UPI003D74A212